MPQKHLFRFSFKNQKRIAITEEFAHLMALEEELKNADDILSKSFPLHTIPVDFEGRDDKGYDEYTRDAMQQFGNIVYVRPETRKLEIAIRKAGYRSRIVRNKHMSEGGQVVDGNKFCLVSDIIKSEIISRIANDASMPVYPIHSFTSPYHSHIDCDYGIVDAARILYTTLRIGPELYLGEPEDTSRRILYSIAAETDYQPRKYLNGRHPNGINFITSDNALFTTGMHHEEIIHLKTHGIEVVEIPLRHVAAGAGLRCVYGEATF